MTNKSIGNSNKSDFRTLMLGYSNEEILNVLKKRSLYQPEAARFAIKEAIKRGLIYSEQDLFSDEFKEMPSKFTIFPKVEDDSAQNRIRVSIARILLIIGVVPIIWGGLKINESNLIEGILLILLGSIWIYASAQLMRALDPKMVNLLFVMLLASVIYVIKLFFGMRNLVIMDFAIPVILCLLIMYGLFFIRRLQN